MKTWIQHNRLMTLLLAVCAAITAAVGMQSQGGSIARAILAVSLFLVGASAAFYLDPLARQAARPLTARLMLGVTAGLLYVFGMYMALRIAVSGVSTALQFSAFEAGLVAFIMLVATVRVVWAKWLP